jgi:hypothetical protein
MPWQWRIAATHHPEGKQGPLNRTRLQSALPRLGGPPKKTNEEFSGNKKAVVIIFRRKESVVRIFRCSPV